MPILLLILKFIGIQLLQALITAQLVKDVVLSSLKWIVTHTKATWDNRIYKKVKFYMTQDKSEHIKLDDKTDSD